MEFLSRLLRRPVLLLLQLSVVWWFMGDFFLLRDSLTVKTLWTTNKQDVHPSHNQIRLLSESINSKHCNSPNSFKTEPAFEKVVFIVIDALGSNFLTSLNDESIPEHKFAMPFLENSIRKKETLAFIAKAATPTVTMPRIKALMSGTIPSFIDLIYNLASDVSKFDDDNILKILKARNKTLVFYGDDTWLSLFDRSIFKRSKETFSFFASDYTTVDTNVTELALLETKLNTIDWDLMILHYLGLDHIGHVFGSNTAPEIETKLLEMDHVIENIYDNLAKFKHKTLIVVCGDHGMSIHGNHGGETKLESETLMAFLTINRDFDRSKKHMLGTSHVEQIDMAPTLSVLTGMPIPTESKGVAVENLVNTLLDPTQASCAALDNLMQLVDLANSQEFHSSSLGDDLMILLEYGSNSSGSNNLLPSQRYFELSRKIQDYLIRTVNIQSYSIYILLMLTFVTFLSILELRSASNRLLFPTVARNERYICYLTLLFPIIMQGSTDFIESEHIFWFLFTVTVTIASFLSVSRTLTISALNGIDKVRVISLLITYLLCCYWTHLNILRDSTLTTFLTVAFLGDSIYQSCDLKHKYRKISLIIGILILLVKYFEQSSNIALRAWSQTVVLITILIFNMINIICEPDSSRALEPSPNDNSRLIRKLASGWVTVIFLLNRKQKFLFFVANMIMEASVNYITNFFGISAVTKCLIYVNFSQFAFYAQGNSNLFTTVDILPAFFGQTQYHLSFSIPLVAVATYSVQVLWYIKLFQRLHGNQSLKRVSDLLNSRNFLNLSYYLYVCTILRNHLFIWSVISPKLVYQFVSYHILLLTSVLISNLPNLLMFMNKFTPGNAPASIKESLL